MKFVRETSPYIRKGSSVKRMMLDVLIALAPVVIFSIIQNGFKGLYVILISIVTMLAVELICVLITKWPSGMKFKELFSKDGFKKVKENYTINNFLAPLISAVIYAMIMPANCDWYVVFIGAFIGMFVGKMVFGGLGSNIFNPAAVGRIFVGVCFGSLINQAYGTAGVDVIASATPLGQIATSVADGFSNLANFPNAIANYSLADLFLGNIPGSMGEVCALLIIVGAVYLFIRRSADFRVTVSTLVSFTLLMLVAALVGGNKYNFNSGEFLLYELLSGGLLFGAVFMVTDPVTSPTTKFGRIAYGSLIGALVVFIRLFGAYPEGMAFSILIGNMFAPMIDYLTRGNTSYNWKQAVGWVLVMAILAVIIGFSVNGGF